MSDDNKSFIYLFIFDFTFQVGQIMSSHNKIISELWTSMDAKWSGRGLI